MITYEENREQFGLPVRANGAPWLIGLSGYARSGKDTLGRILCDEYGYARYAFADKVRDLAAAASTDVRNLAETYGWEAAKTEPLVRLFLQDIGLGCREVFGPDVWVNALFDQPLPERVVITDVRFPNEADRVRAQGGQVWRIIRPGTAPVNDHPSETALDLYPFDRIITNDGTVEDLRLKVLRGGGGL